ncbi:UDP-N-acetylmuramoyl-L-alanyl-D-glutamate--2,6-diaminopimelate ligase [Candidatus Poriferisodalis sp.]|uniref:UDP-N-acetylmuramoyl-L-alanyl-D-glutamate--2, 6-diaminopimelate ligase n=1 Tax=Candidatus Poriferisodalis sp. TaxID=3101277 RepID=UPI003B5904AB
MSSPRSAIPMSVHRLASEIGGTYVAPSGRHADETYGGAALVHGITHDSRSVAPGVMFCCVVGRHHDGHAFASEAITAGAVALMVERILDVGVPQIAVPTVRGALGPASAAVWGQPWRRCAVVGVTGTSGKTTVAHAIGAIARACGTSCEVMGTLVGRHTTPEAPEVCRRLSEAADAGTEMVVLEVSSHALALGRVDGASFAAGVFTNLSHEHLDFHITMEDYFDAKARLFDGRCEIALVNVADRWGRRLAAKAAGTTGTVVEWQPSDIEDVTVSVNGLSGRWRGRPIQCGLLGRFNAANVAAAAATASALGFDNSAIAPAIAAVKPVRGRLWPVNGPGDDITVLVDYAHKPEALAAALASARELSGPDGRLWAVFGAGGDRDPSKRAPMGAAADHHADMLVLTSDNPRSEDPADIAAEIAAGAGGRHDTSDGLHVELDRSLAISLAIEGARAGDVVVVAGKGHETTQVTAGRSTPFDDATVAADALQIRRSAKQ